MILRDWPGTQRMLSVLNPFCDSMAYAGMVLSVFRNCVANDGSCPEATNSAGFSKRVSGDKATFLWRPAAMNHQIRPYEPLTSENAVLILRRSSSRSHVWCPRLFDTGGTKSQFWSGW